MFLIINTNNEILGFTTTNVAGSVEVSKEKYEEILSKINCEDMRAFYSYGTITYQAREKVVIKPSYAQLVESKIREKYSVSDELAILRQKDTKTSEYQEYYSYCEQCKSFAKMES